MSVANTTDLFDEFIDGDVYNSIFNELDLPVAEASLPSFDCLGEVNVKVIQISQNGYFYSKFGPQNIPYQTIDIKSKPESICLFNKSWDKGTCLFNYLDELFKLASMELMTLDEASTIHCGSVVADSSSDNRRNFYQIRKDCIELCVFVNDFLYRLLSYSEYHWALQGLVDQLKKKLKSLRKQLGRITELPEYIYQFCAHSAGNRCEEAGYHVVHCRFDLFWLDIYLSSTLDQASRCVQTPHLQQCYLPLIKELFDLVLLRFIKLDVRDLLKKSPFNCTCIQEMWLMLQILVDSDSKSNYDKGFWSVFENLMLSFLKLRSTGSEKFKIDSSQISHSSACLFALWFTYNVGKLYSFNVKDVPSNYSLVESIMKHLMSIEISEQDLRSCLNFVEKICLELWEPKTEPLLILWEYFQKRLNQLFYVPGQDLDSIATVRKGALSILTLVKERLEDSYLVKNSFEHFLRIVGLHLRRCSGSQNQRHWNLLTGRIYSKLPPPKLFSLNQTGEHHFVSLFLTLALSADLNQVVNKFSDLCEAYFSARGTLSCEIFKGQLAGCIISVERGESIARLVAPMTKCLASADVERNKELFSLTIDGFSDILDHHHSLSLGQHLFIDSWISRYLSSCPSYDSFKILDVLLSLVSRIKRIIEIDPSSEMLDLVERIWNQIGCYLMSSASSNQGILADIAANLASIYLCLSNSSRFTNIVSTFANNQSSDVRVVQRFLSLLLENPRVKDVLAEFDNLVMETWLKSQIVLNEADVDEIKCLSRVVSQMPDFKRICGPKANEIFNHDDLLLEYFSQVHCKYQSSNESEKLWICNKLSNYLKDLDKWLRPIVSVCPSTQQVSKLYYTVGSLFSLVSHMLYVKSKPNNVIQSVINLMLLPVSAHNSEVKIHPFILSAIRKTLHLFLQGLNNLGPASDQFIGRSVKELISVYIPRCLSNTGPLPSQNHISSFSLVSLFNELETSLIKLILDNVSVSFFRPKARNQLPHCIQAVRFIKEILLLHSSSDKVLIAILNYSMDQICDIIMYCDSKASVYIMSKDVIKLFFENNMLKQKNAISDAVGELLSRLCVNCLAWSSRQLFDLLYLLCSYIPAIMKRFLPKLLQHITLIETKRGVTNDKILRLGYERIQSRLSTLKL